MDLSDFFNVGSNWEERRYDVADRSDIEGIGTEVGSCSGTSAQVLEIRLSNRFRELRFSAAQANDSLRSDQELSVQVIGNNEQLDIRSVPFNQVQPFTINVSGVNALQIRLSLDPTVPNCRGNVIGVLLDPVLA